MESGWKAGLSLLLLLCCLALPAWAQKGKPPKNPPNPPDPVTDLTLGTMQDNSIPLTWTATGQNGETASGYDLRSLDLVQFGLVPSDPPEDFDYAAFCSDNQPSIAFIHASNGGAGDLTFAHWNADTQTWERQILERRKARSPFLVYSNGEPSMCYYMTGGGVKFARRIGSSWTIETIDAAAGNDCTLAYDPAGNPAVIYPRDMSGDGNSDLVFAQRGASGWQPPRLVDSNGHFEASLVYDGAGNPTVAYSIYPAAWSERYVRLATSDATGMNWTKSNIGAPGYEVTHAFERGRAVVFYNDYAYVYAASWNDETGMWEKHIVDVKPYASRLRAALDPSTNRLSVIYTSRLPDGTYVLKFAHPLCTYAEGAPQVCAASTAKAAEAAVRDTPTPDAFILSENYPNPFNPTTSFSLSVERAQHVRVEVFDLLGRRVALLHDGMLEAGQAHRFTFDARMLPSGTYLYRAAGASFSSVKHMTLMK